MTSQLPPLNDEALRALREFARAAEDDGPRPAPDKKIPDPRVGTPSS